MTNLIEGSVLFSDDHRSRFELRRWWTKDPQRLVAWLMLNPSVADRVHDDPTVRRICAFSRAWGYDGLIVVNLMPFVSSTPTNAFARWREATVPRAPERQTEDFRSLRVNMQVIHDVANVASMRVVAYGNLPDFFTTWAERSRKAFRGDLPVVAFHSLGMTRDGHPKHPLARGRARVPDDFQPVLWRSER